MVKYHREGDGAPYGERMENHMGRWGYHMEKMVEYHIRAGLGTIRIKG